MNGVRVHGTKIAVYVVYAAVGGFYQPGVVAEGVNAIVNVALGLPQGLTVVQRIQPRQFCRVGGYKVCCLQQDIAALLGIHIAPVTRFVEGLFCRSNGFAGIRYTAFIHMVKHFPCGGVYNINYFFGSSFGPFPINQHFVNWHTGFPPVKKHLIIFSVPSKWHRTLPAFQYPN